MSKKNTKRESNMMLKGIVVLVVILIVGAGAFMISRDNTTIPEDTAQTAPTTALISAADYQNDFTETGHILLDVRTPAEFEDGYIDGAMNINVETLADRLSEIPQDTPIVVYCRSGNRSARAATILNEAGYTPVYDLGGIQDWAAAGYDVVR